jgi:hypothetical protein
MGKNDMDAAEAIDFVMGEVNYVRPEFTESRRYLTPGLEFNTGTPVPHAVKMRNARAAGENFSLDVHGFTLIKHQSHVTDFPALASRIATTKLVNPASLDEEPYTREICELVKRATGADFVLSLNCMVRKAVTDPGSSQPPASDVHVDMTSIEAHRRAQVVIESHGMSGRKYSRFIASSLWRAFSAPPQDWPLAVCDARSVGSDEGIANYLVLMDRAPTDTEVATPLVDPDRLPAGTIFHHNPAHRWYFYPNMTSDEALLLKLHDSDLSCAWRTPHVAFHDRTANVVHPRESIEFRTVAYFD